MFEVLGYFIELVYLMDGEILDEDVIFVSLIWFEEKFGLFFFIVSEISCKFYNLDGSMFDLIEGEVSWYFKYCDYLEDVVVDIGKWEDIYFYIDIKIYDFDGKFFGFFGIGKSFCSFLSVFDSYKK